MVCRYDCSGVCHFNDPYHAALIAGEGILSMPRTTIELQARSNTAVHCELRWLCVGALGDHPVYELRA